MRLISAFNATFKVVVLSLIALPGFVFGQSQGGSFCVSSNLLCVNAVVQGNTVTYQLSTTYGFNDIGWMAVGFGTGMLNTPLVVVWPNNDGTITLSQRQTSIRRMPEVVRNPPQVASLDWQYSNLKTETTTIAFKQALPTSSDLSRVPMIWAVATTKPSGSAVDAIIVQHIAQGTFIMDLTGSVAPLTAGPYTATSSVASATASQATASTIPTDASSTSPQSLDLSSGEKKLVRHAILMSVGTLILLPIGILIPRYARTIPALQSSWVNAHALVQLVLAGPIIFAGWALGYQFVKESGLDHFQDTHTRVGLAFLILYCIQIIWGLTIHLFKPTRKPVHEKIASGESGQAVPGSTQAESPIVSSIKYRLPQNYAHAIIGLTLIGLAFYNVHRGYDYEWQYVTGRNWTNDLRRADHWWTAWVVIIPVFYVLGLGLLPRQWRQEYAARNPGTNQTEGGSSSPEPLKA